MAIYHFTSKVISREKGQSAVAAAAYRRAARMTDERTGVVHDYSNKKDVIHSEILCPAITPEWLTTLVNNTALEKAKINETLWNKVEDNEKRKDAQLARELEFALPIELEVGENIELARSFIKEQLVSLGMVADWSFHNDEGNPHVHVMLTMRSLSDEGFGSKVRAWNDKKLYGNWRAKWAEYVNYHLAKHGHDARIDHRSYLQQGIGLTPTIHQGKKIRRMEKDGISTQRYAELNAINKANLKKIAQSPEILLDKVGQSYSTFTREQVVHELGRYIGDKGLFQGINYAQSSSEESTTSVLTAAQIADLFQQIEKHDSVFSEREIAKAVSAYTDNAEAFSLALIQVKASPELLPLGPGDDGRDRYTTRSLFALENALQDTADDLRKAKSHSVKTKLVNKVYEAFEKENPHLKLSEEQKSAIRHITQGSDVSLLVGRAGTGKSFSLGIANKIWKRAGYRVHGIALAGKAAEGLDTGADIRSRTIESFKYALKTGSLKLSYSDIIVLDEAGMVDSQTLYDLLEVIKRLNAKLVLVGDHGQVQPIGPGSPFRALLERLGFAELTTIYRQKTAWQAEATLELAAGKTHEALTRYDRAKRIVFAATPETALQQMVKQWFDDDRHESISTLLLAHSNEDVMQLNLLAREKLIKAKQLINGITVNTKLDALTLGLGERLMFLQNSQKLGVKNGTLGTLEGIKSTEEGDFLTIRLDDKKGTLITFNTKDYSQLTYGYAATVYKSQGATVDKTYVYAGGAGWNKNLTYVALSRHVKDAYLFADKQTYATLAALKRGLGRWGMKDSVLDFPYAYALRRGFDEGKLWSRLQQHVKNTLKRWVGSSKTIAEDEVRHSDKQMLREDARLVAQYVDANRLVGSSWQAVQVELQSVGLSALDYKAPEFLLIANSEAYQTFIKAMTTRDALAAQLVDKMDYFNHAIEVSNIDADKLKAQSARHTRMLRVAQYKDALLAGKTVLRDRLAAEIAMDMKGHYAALQSYKIESREIQTQAKNHERRRLFIKLNLAEKGAFIAVEDYQLLCQEVGKLTAAIKQYPGSKPLNPAITLQWQTLMRDRDEIAARIYKQIEKHQMGLDFYQIGLAATPQFEKPSEAAIRFAEKRWFRLQQHAARHGLKEHVLNYTQAKEKGDSRAEYLAHLIMQEVKAFHGAIVDTTEDPKALWGQIRKDAKAFLRNQFVASLPIGQQVDFKVVEQFREARRISNIAWRELFEHPDFETWTREQKAEQFAAAKEKSKAREALSAKILEQPQRYQKGLEFYEIDLASLEKAASQFAIREKVAKLKTYFSPELIHSRVQAVIMNRARVAKVLCDNPKSYHGALVEAGIAWKDVYRFARPFEQQAFFAELLPEERIFIRLVQQYRKIGRKLGKAYQTLKAYQAKKETRFPGYKHQQALVDALSAKRDKLAAALLPHLMTTEFSVDRLLFEASFPAVKRFEKLLSGLDHKKLQTQADRHHDKVQQLQELTSLQQESLERIKRIVEGLEVKGYTQSKNAYLDWLITEDDAAFLEKPVLRRPTSYRHALIYIGSSDATFGARQSIKSVLRKTLSFIFDSDTIQQDSPLTDDQTQCIRKAQRIVSQTKPIKGTLAERYLREHRNIQAPLSANFRFHPRLYHFETQQFHPALVVVAKNGKGVVQAIQTIYLDPVTANKASLESVKLTRGLLSHGEVGVLVQQGKTNQRIAVAEGPETALSIAEAAPDLTVYAVLGSSNFSRVPIKSDTKEVLFCADNDGQNAVSQKKLIAAAKTLSKRGITVSQVMPHTVKQDFNDVLKNEGIEAVRDYLKKPQEVEKALTPENLKATVSNLVNSFESQPKYIEPELYSSYAFDWQIQAAEDSNAGDIAAVLSSYAARDYVHKTNTLDEAMGELLAKWGEERQQSPHTTQLMLAADDSQVELLNEGARYYLQLNGQLQNEHIIATSQGELAIAEGEQLRLLVAHEALGIEAGTLATVIAVENNALMVSLDSTQQLIRLDLNTYDHINYGYAAKVSEMKGKQADSTYLLATPNLDSQSTLIALSRHKSQMRVYWSLEDFPSYGNFVAHLSAEYRTYDSPLKNPLDLALKPKPE